MPGVSKDSVLDVAVETSQSQTVLAVALLSEPSLSEKER